MKTLLLFASVCFLMVGTFGAAPAQQFQVGAGPGIALLTGPDILTKKISENGFGWGGIQFAILGKARIGLGRASIVRLVLDPGYTFISGSETIQGQTAKISSSLFSLGAGAEFVIPTGSMVKPYLGLDFALNIFGKTTVEYAGQKVGESKSSETRFGIVPAGGVEIAFSRQVGVDIGVKFHLANLIGKQDNNEDTLAPDNSGKEQTISALGITAGVVFYL
jgi:opacity protein-like surface antigen